MGFRITGLSPAPFRHLYGLDDATLATHGAIRYRVDNEFGFPDRIELRDAEPGETVLLVNHVHQPANTPFRASHAIFVREGATMPFDAIDTVPDALRRRMLSLRAFDAAHMMVDAALVDGREAEAAIEHLFSDPAVAYLHAHYATRGCYAARIDPAH
ncbi:MAG: hypothetical protein A2579_03045 [Lysobacterales bacterium RIFOXYD1_FULL_69_11]|nr:MAG: hypothetical protein A2190_01890 [Xanthomonadales bacterium RIFOXYA1_FULL_69_10]OHE86577.1 MAG: hypothetical protein A2579_03045 [Xanthomonadales bacterium RIFOXYD1_FULL_69_11]